MTKPAAATPSRADLLWKTIARYDFYIGTTISRHAAVTALNGIVVAAVITQAGPVLSSFAAHPVLRIVAATAIVAAFLSAVAATALVAWAVSPFLGPPRAAVDRSVIYFGDVAARDHAQYESEIRDLSEAALVVDLTRQAHQLAQALDGKFRHIRRAWLCLTLGLLPSLVTLAIARFAVILAETLK